MISVEILLLLCVSLLAYSHCDQGYLLYGDFCYQFVTERVKKWQDAEDCLARGANLVSVQSQEEEEFLSLYTQSGRRRWVRRVLKGGSSLKEALHLLNVPINAGYFWSDGMPVTHTNWGNGEPNNHEGREDCVEMVSSTSGTSSWWNDLICDAHQDWICMISKAKTPILPPAPPSPVPGTLFPQ
uniref:C-type lectin domain-containing protein n=1 Tax=Mola mola TaxID=94237 RepID=A0A3Q3VUM8_MOLML